MQNFGDLLSDELIPKPTEARFGSTAQAMVATSS